MTTCNFPIGQLRTLEEVIAAHPLPFELEQLQKEDIVKLAGWRRALADLPVGYGKTVIATAAALMLGPAVTVILVPPILILQWEKWLQSLPGVGLAIAYTGGPAKRAALPIQTARWLVMSYGVFRNDLKHLTAVLEGRSVLTAVDEAQALKNHDSKLFQGVQQFSQGRDLFLMTGTPMSGPADAYSYIRLLSPEVYRSFSHFCNIHVAERDYFDQPTVWRDLDLMRANLGRRRVYRTKEEVHAALPLARYIPIYYDLEPEHMRLYQRLMEEQLLEVPEGKIDATTAQSLQHCAQQIVTNYGHFAGDPTKRPKVFDLVDVICDEIGLGQEGASKLILWTQYKMTSASVLDYMQEKHTAAQAKNQPGPGWAMAAYSGANSKASVASFLDDPETTTLVAQPGSAGAGLNPQHLCWNCAFVEFPTTTIPFIQAAGRIDRKGQRYRPNIFLFIARGTIQELKAQQLMAKDDLVGESSGTKLSIRNLILPPRLPA